MEDFSVVLVAERCLYGDFIILPSFILHGYFILLLNLTSLQHLSLYQMSISAWTIHVCKDGCGSVGCGGERMKKYEEVSWN